MSSPSTILNLSHFNACTYMVLNKLESYNVETICFDFFFFACLCLFSYFFPGQVMKGTLVD